MIHFPNNITVIGSKELVKFPAQALEDVPAKIDTGANLSSLWASDIREEKGELSFVLFDKSSRYYTGERVVVHDYRVTRIRNSFGQSEARFKVKLSVVIGGRRIAARFTLADRSKNTFPVLIGNHTLRHKFLVDVRANADLPRVRQARVLVLSVLPKDFIQEFVAKINRDFPDDLQCVHHAYDDFTMEIIDGRVRFYCAADQSTLDDYDLVYFKNYFNREEYASAMAEYLRAKQISFIDKEVAWYHAKTKLTAYTRLALGSVPVPDTLFIPGPAAKKSFSRIAETFGVPFIFKSASAERGRNNFLIHDEKEFARSFVKAGDQIEFLAQRFIPNMGDVRVLVFGRNIYAAIKRTAPNASTHLTNTSVQGKAEWLEVEALTPQLRALCLQAADVMQRQVAGVDIMQSSSTKEWYVLEVNNAPQIASGSFVDEKALLFGKFLRRYTNKVSLKVV